MIEYIRLAEYNDSDYGLLTQFIDDKDNILFAYTKVFDHKYTYEFVSDLINNELIEKYLNNNESNEI